MGKKQESERDDGGVRAAESPPSATERSTPSIAAPLRARSLVSNPERAKIHHTSEFIKASFESYACYDVRVEAGGGAGFVRHFDKNGVEVWLPQELRTAASAAKQGRR
jgi:hypothetical protein